MYAFKNAVMTNDGNAAVIPVAKWKDYDGEQIQITIGDDNKIYLDNTNIRSVYAEDLELIEQIAFGYVSENGTANNLTEKEVTKVLRK